MPGSEKSASKPKVRRAKAPTLSAGAGKASVAQIAEAAYYMAERRRFEPGGELEDWLAAERLLDHGGAPATKG